MLHYSVVYLVLICSTQTGIREKRNLGLGDFTGVEFGSLIQMSQHTLWGRVSVSLVVFMNSDSSVCGWNSLGAGGGELPHAE